MRNYLRTLTAAAVLSLLPIASPTLAVEPSEVDFSCMKSFVRAKIVTTDRYKEYDVVLHNQCPGAVYWSMCIERINPWTRAIVESHTPTGYLEPEKKSRVNVQMKRDPENRFRNRYQEFYVNLGFAIDAAAKSPCSARQCETLNGPIIKKVRANESDWKKAKEALAAKLKSECPDSGWENSQRINCEEENRAASQESMGLFEQTDKDLRQQLAETEPEHCRLYGGALAE